jgi:hypothetical protein
LKLSIVCKGSSTGLSSDPNPILVVAKLIRHFLKNLRQLDKNLGGYVTVGCGYFGLGNQSICANQSQDKCSDR